MRRAVVGSALLMSLASTASALAQAPPAAAAPKPVPTFEITLPVTLDERYLGDITVRVAGSEISFAGERLLTLLRDELTPPALEAIAARMADGRLTPAAATTEGLLVKYNSSLQEIRITTAVSAQQRRVLNFRVSPSEDKSTLSPPENFAAFVNLTAVYQQVWENGLGGDTGRQPLTGTIDVGGRIGGDGGVAFISRQNYDEGRRRFIQRTETQLIYDRVDDLVRVTAGDLRYRGTGFQDLPRLAGVTVERFFGLEPSRVFRPVGQTSFELERPSTVDVRINGVVIRQLLLQPGRYDLRDFPLVQGANDVDLVVRDDTGREQVISSRNFFDFSLLEPGLSDFSFSAGVRARAGGSAIRYSDDPAFSGFYRRGMSPTLTLGGDLQFDRKGATAGVGAVWASPVGIFRLEAAGSQRKGIGGGAAVDAGYAITGRFADNRWRWTGQVNGQMQTRSFSTLSDVERPGGAPLRPTAWSVNANVEVSDATWNITASGQFDKGRGGGSDRGSALVGATYAVSPRLSLGAFARYADIGARTEKGGFFQLSWRLGRDHGVRASYDTPRQQATLNYRYSPATAVGATQADINIRRDNRADTLNLTGSLFHTANRFEATVQHDVFSDADFASGRIQSTRAAVSTSLVYAGGQVALARPVREGFALFSPHPSLAGKTIRVDPSERGARAVSDGFGPAVVPDLTTYGRSSLYVDVTDLPPGYDLGSGQFGLEAPLYAGYRFVVGSDASVTVLGRIVVGDGKTPLALVGGRMEFLGDDPGEPIAVFTNRNGRLAGSGLRPGKYRLTLFTDPPFVTDIAVPAGSEGLVDIGELKVPEP